MVYKLRKSSACDNRKRDFISKSGYKILFDDSIWHLDKNRTIKFETIKFLLDGDSIFESFKYVMKFYVMNYSSSHCLNMSSFFTLFLRKNLQKTIDTNSIINFRHLLGAEKEYVLGALAGFLKKWHELGYDGVSNEVVDLLNSWRLKGNIKGDVVKRLDPQQGPLTDIELQNFNESAAILFEKNEISIDQLAMVRLLSAIGRRPIQFSHMKLKDIMHGSNNNQDVAYVLNIPKAKQRGISFRESFKLVQVTEDLWHILDLQRLNVISNFENKFGKISNQIILKLPLFPDYKLLDRYSEINQLENDLSLDLLHCTRSKFSQAAEIVVQKAEVMSERTGELININPQRFRYSVGTRAAREGYGALIIAELLDHTDTQNAQVYVENIPDYARKINDKVGNLLVPYANAFKGVIVNDENQAQRGKDSSSRIRLNGYLHYRVGFL